MSNDEQPSKFAAIVKVGSKGQIVILQEARALFGIEPGAALLLPADEARGIAIVRQEPFRKFIDDIMPDIRANG